MFFMSLFSPFWCPWCPKRPRTAAVTAWVPRWVSSREASLRPCRLQRTEGNGRRAGSCCCCGYTRRWGWGGLGKLGGKMLGLNYWAEENYRVIFSDFMWFQIPYIVGVDYKPLNYGFLWPSTLPLSKSMEERRETLPQTLLLLTGIAAPNGMDWWWLGDFESVKSLMHLGVWMLRLPTNPRSAPTKAQPHRFPYNMQCCL